MSGRFRHWPYALLLAAGAAWLIAEALLNHRALGTSYDLGIYDQVVWNLAHGRLFQTTLVYETKGTYDHFEPILALIAPLYWILPNVRVLLVIQSLALALGSLPIYLYARYRFKEVGAESNWLALLPAAAYLMYPPLHAANLNNFHEVALLPPLLGMALYGLLTGRRKILWLFLGLCLLVKEDVTVTAVAFGLYIALLQPRGFRRRDGVILTALAVVWGILVLYVLYPAISGGMAYPFVHRRYSWLGDSPTDAARNLVVDPATVLGRIAQPPKLRFLFQLLAPLLFLPLLGWPIIFLAVPVLIYLMMSDYQPQWSIGSYYNPPLLAFLFFATIQAVVRLAGWTSRRGWSIRPVLTGMFSILLGVVVVSYGLALQGPDRSFFQPASIALTDRAQAAQEIVAQVPTEASISTEWWLAPHLSQRKEVYTLLARPAEAPEYQIVELRETSEGAPIYPLAVADAWPPVYHEYQPVATAQPFQLSKLARSVPLVPLEPLEAPPTPLDVSAYAWLDHAGADGQASVRPGEEARLMLAWRRTGKLDRRFVFFVHLLRSGGQEAANGLPDIIAQSGHEPSAGRYPTTFWESWTNPGVVLDEQRIAISPETEPGTYYVWVGAFDKETGDRLELGGPGKTLRLVSTLEVEP